MKGVNCRHTFWAFVEGISTPIDYDKLGYPDKEENERIYEESQEQRRLEREIRAIKREIAALEGLGEDSASASLRLKRKQAELRAFIDSTGRTRRRNREWISKTELDKLKKGDIINIPPNSWRRGEKMTDYITGASGAIPRDDLVKMDEHAARYYEEIRKRTGDIGSIAENTGFSLEEIKIIKEHIFINEHELGDDKFERFYPNYDMAISWQRLIEGKNIQEMDIMLLKHELMEYGLMKQGLLYDEAHGITEKTYNYKKYTDELDEMFYKK